MSLVLKTLVPEFREKIENLLENCKQRGVIMRPNEGLRSTYKQGIYWRQSRSWSKTISPKINELKNAGADFLAYSIEAVGPQFGPRVTDAIPGLSWHQWGEAIDCVWMVGNKEIWVSKNINGINGFKVYADEATKLGLTAGGYWPSLKDWPHVQLRSAASPLTYYTLNEIDDIMYARFPHTYTPGM